MSTSAYKTRGRGEKAEINLKQLLRWSKKFGSLSYPKFATGTAYRYRYFKKKAKIMVSSNFLILQVVACSFYTKKQTKKWRRPMTLITTRPPRHLESRSPSSRTTEATSWTRTRSWDHSYWDAAACTDTSAVATCPCCSSTWCRSLLPFTSTAC